MKEAQRIAELEKQLADALARIAEIERHLFSEAWRHRLSGLIKKDGK